VDLFTRFTKEIIMQQLPPTPSQFPPPSTSPPNINQPPPPPMPPDLTAFSVNSGDSGGLGSDIVVIKSDDSQPVRKLCTGTVLGSKWQKRSVRVVEPSPGILQIQYAKRDKDFDKDSKSIKKHNLARPGFKEISDKAMIHTLNLPDDDNFCIEFHLEGERKNHGRALVLRFNTRKQMDMWEYQCRKRFEQSGDNEQQDDDRQFGLDEEKYTMVSDDSVEDSSDDDDDDDENENEDNAKMRQQSFDQPPPPPPSGNPPSGNPPSGNPPSHKKQPRRKSSIMQMNANSNINNPLSSSSGELEEYDSKIHLKKSEVAKQITFSGLKNHQVDIDVLTEEALDELDISQKTEFEYVHRDSLLRWIEKKKIEKQSNITSIKPVPTEESTILKSDILSRHLSGLTPAVLNEVQNNNMAENTNTGMMNDVRSTQEKSKLLPTPSSKEDQSHNRASTMYTLSAIQDVATAAAGKEAIKLGLNVNELDTFGNASAESMAILFEDDDELGDNWNEKFLQAHEMNIQKHHDSMIKGKKLYELNQKMAKLASIAARTIVDEFALPPKLKKIKPLEWHDDGDDSQKHKNSSLSIEMEDGMQNDVLYTYQGMLIRVVGINTSLEDAMTSRKVTGHEVKGMNVFQEASTTIKQEMVSARQRQLNSQGYLSTETSSVKIPEVHTTQAYIVDYNGFRLLVTTIPPIDEEYTLKYGRVDPQDPNSDFHDHNLTLKRLMSAISKELNLKDHKIIANGAAKKIPLGSEVQGHECSDGRFYAINMSRLMPPDLPEGGSDVTTKLLRSELVQSYNTSLSSDSFSSILNKPQNEASGALLDDAEPSDVDCGNASRYLRTVRIPEFVAMLDTMTLFPYESHTLTKAMHAHGINLRHLGSVASLTKLPHIKELCVCEMIARTAKDILNENQRKQIIDSRRHVMQLISDLANQGRHLNDDAMVQLLEYNVAVTDDATRNVIDFFNLILGSSKSSEENHLFWKNVLVPRLSKKFGIKCTTSSRNNNVDEHSNGQLLLGNSDSPPSPLLSTPSLPSQSSSFATPSSPLLVSRSTTNANQLFHALQFHCGVRFVSSEHYQFDMVARPFTEVSQLLETYPKVKLYNNRSLESSRVAEAAEVYRDSDQLEIALVAFKLRAEATKNQDAPSKVIEFALANNDIANVYRLMANKVEAHDRIYVHDTNRASSTRMLQEGLEYTKLALSSVPHTHAVASRIYETRMKIYNDLNDIHLMTVSFGMAIKAALSHYGDIGHHPLISELHCMYGSLVAEHGGQKNINLGIKNLEKSRKLASRIMGAKHPILSTYASELARVYLMSGDTRAALEHYQQALLLIQSSVGLHSLEASNLYYEMAKIKQMHSHSLGQVEAEEALILAERSLGIRERVALTEVGEDKNEEKGEEKQRDDNSGRNNLQKAMEMSNNSKFLYSYHHLAIVFTNNYLIFICLLLVHIVGALSTAKGSINDMLVHSYRQVAEMASDERAYERAMECYERLVVCLRCRAKKTEVTLQLIQKATREIINIKMIELKPNIAEKVRKLHAKYDPHKNLHEHNKSVFAKVVKTVMRRSAGNYFEELMNKCNMYENENESKKQEIVESKKFDDSDYETGRNDEINETSPIELACLVELSNSV
jgi:tetratricopeptide (TPR) repeat protein